MPSSPKIPKDKILETALLLLIRDGYSLLNIKTLAKELGCSTQPISWHFGNMDGLRKALAEYALGYANEKMRSTANGIKAFANVGEAYINMAFEEPHLFRYLYMSGEIDCQAENFEVFNSDENAIMAEQIAMQLKIPIEKVKTYGTNMMIYTHGLASFIVSGFVKASKEEVWQMVNHLSDELLLQAGASDICTN